MSHTAWEAVIGLEVHVQLLTNTKLFSGAKTTYGAEPNSQACAIDLGLPGVLPVLNEAAVSMAVKFGLAIQAKIAKMSVFARKNYFYPDLPKGYQISQYELPIVHQGRLSFVLDTGETREVGITRAHLEEDAGKSLHESFSGFSGIDLNRAGIPLIEIVSEPELRSAKEAVAYLKTLHALIRYLEISDGNMQEGSFRCDANVSVRKKGDEKLGTRTETKNVNSFKFVEKAIDYEIARQIEILENGGVVNQETRLYDPLKNETRPMRSKEEANDYRYFPDPDLLPVMLEDHFIETIQKSLPELPPAKAARFVKHYQLSDYDAKILTTSRELADYFEEVVRLSKSDPKLCANWIMGDLLGALNKAGLEFSENPISAKRLAGLLQRISDQTLSGKMAKTVFEGLWESPEATADNLIAKHGLKQITDIKVIEGWVDEVIKAHPNQVAALKGGKQQLFGFFVGQVMKLSQGTANPDQVNALLKQKLES